MLSIVPKRSTILTITIGVEAVLLLIATIWSKLSNIDLKNHFAIDGRSALIGLVVGVGIACLSIILIWLGAKRNLPLVSDLREIVHREVAPIFKHLGFLDILLVAVVSGVCEEIFFRGVMQCQFGLFATSIVFGLFHCPTPRYLSYGLWAGCAGLLLGYLFLSTHSLWAPIVAHGVSNLISLSYLRYKVLPDEEA